MAHKLAQMYAATASPAFACWVSVTVSEKSNARKLMSVHTEVLQKVLVMVRKHTGDCVTL